MAWDVYLTDEVDAWLYELAAKDLSSFEQAVIAIEALAEAGPTLGRPLVDRIKGATVHNMKELRPGSSGSTEIRILFVFDPWRSAILLVAGNKSGVWSEWYRRNIPIAENRYAQYVQQRQKEEGDQ